MSYEVCCGTISELRVTYEKLVEGHFSNSTYVDGATLAYLLPFSKDIGNHLVTIFDEDNDGIVRWRYCLGGLLVCIEGDICEKLHLLFHMHSLMGTVVSEDKMTSLLTAVFSAADRIYQAGYKNGGPGSGDMFLNVTAMVKEITSDLYLNSPGQGVTLHDMQIWAEDHPSFTKIMLNPDTNRNDIILANQYASSGTSGTSRSYTYKWSPILSDPDIRVPPSRNKHATCLYDGCIYMYGGRDGNIALKDLWKYDIAQNKWDQLRCMGDRPSLLEEHSMVAYKGKLYVFGGKFGYGSSDDTPLWILDLDKLHWKKSCHQGAHPEQEKLQWLKHNIDSEVMTPAGRRGHTAVISNNAMHIYGGYMDLKGSSSELWTFDFEGEMWHLAYSIQMSEEGPGARHCHTAVVHDSAMWVFGGMTDLQLRSDLWKWNFNLRCWTKIRCRQGPPELCGHSACKMLDGMLVYGGESHGALKNEVWKFHFASQTWQKISLHGVVPSPRSKHTAVMVTPFNITNSATACDRAHSVPYLRGCSPLPKEQQRPLSSPPSVDPDSVQASKVFKNRISPLAGREKIAAHPKSQTKDRYLSQESNKVNEKSEISARDLDRAKEGYLPLPSRDVLYDSQYAISTDRIPLLANFPRSVTFDDSWHWTSEEGVDNPTYFHDTKGHFRRIYSGSAKHALYRQYSRQSSKDSVLNRSLSTESIRSLQKSAYFFSNVAAGKPTAKRQFSDDFVLDLMQFDSTHAFPQVTPKGEILRQFSDDFVLNIHKGTENGGPENLVLAQKYSHENGKVKRQFNTSDFDSHKFFDPEQDGRRAYSVDSLRELPEDEEIVIPGLVRSGSLESLVAEIRTIKFTDVDWSPSRTVVQNDLFVEDIEDCDIKEFDSDQSETLLQVDPGNVQSCDTCHNEETNQSEYTSRVYRTQNLPSSEPREAAKYDKLAVTPDQGKAEDGLLVFENPSVGGMGTKNAGHQRQNRTSVQESDTRTKPIVQKSQTFCEVIDKVSHSSSKAYLSKTWSEGRQGDACKTKQGSSFGCGYMTMFVFGGREPEAQNLAIKPLSAWKCDILAGKPSSPQLGKVLT